MRNSRGIVFVLAGSIAVLAGVWAMFFRADARFSREALLENSRVPLRREFPLDASKNACQSLYAHACTKVIESFQLPKDRSSWTFSLSDSAERLLDAKGRYLALLPSVRRPTPRSAEIRDFFGACMNEKGAADDERATIKAEMDRIAKIDDIDKFAQLLAERVASVEQGFVSFNTLPNQDDPKRNDVVFDTELMSLPERSYYHDPKIVADLTDLITEFFNANGLPDGAARAKAIVEFEKALAEKYPLPAEIRDRMALRDYLTADVFKTRYPKLRLGDFLQRISKDVPLRTLVPEALAFLDASLTKAMLPTLRDVILYQGLVRWMDDGYPQFFAKRFEFQKKHFGGPEQRPPRIERCTKMVMSGLGKELDAELVPVLFPGFPREDVTQLAESIRKSLLDSVTHSEWLSESARTVAKEKVTKAELMLVEPQTPEEWNFLPLLTFDGATPVSNRKKLATARIDKDLRELSEPRKRREWLMGPATVNAYYVPNDNVFVLPVGILQYPVYDKNNPRVANFGGIGMVIGHELGHGVDDKGAKYDPEGRLHDWMTDADRAAFQKHGEHFLKVFDKAGFGGRLSLGENIADHVGLRVAYSAAFPNGEGAKKDKQEFFLSYARTWCQVVRPAFRELLRKTDPHAPGEARVDVQVRQLPGFAEAFDCKAGDAMYVAPADRLQLW